MTTHDDGSRGPNQRNDTEIQRMERRLAKLEYDLADFKQQVAHDTDAMRQSIESKQRVVIELHKAIDELKRTTGIK